MNEDTAGWLALFMATAGSIAWTVSPVLREDIKASKGQRRNPVAAKRRNQQKTATSIRNGYLKWAGASTAIVLLFGIGVLLIAFDALTTMDEPRNPSARKWAYLLVWVVWLYSSTRLWAKFRHASSGD